MCIRHSADYPKGYAMILTDGILRLRYADDPARPRLRQPGEIVKIRITLFPTANLFMPGIASGSISPRAISRNSTSIRTPANRRAGAPQACRGEHGVRRCRSAEPGGVAASSCLGPVVN